MHWPTARSRSRLQPRVTVSEAAKTLDVSERSVENAKAVFSKGEPELQEAMKRGDVAPRAAADLAKLPADQQREVVAAGPEAMKAMAADIRAGKVKVPKRMRTVKTTKPEMPFDVSEPVSVAAVREWPKVLGDLARVVEKDALPALKKASRVRPEDRRTATGRAHLRMAAVKLRRAADLIDEFAAKLTDADADAA